MTRIPHAAKVLTAQVEATKKNAKWEPIGQPDGFDVYRSIRFDKVTSKWLAPLLRELADNRIYYAGINKGQLIVQFVHTTLADTKDTYNLADAETVVSQRLKDRLDSLPPRDADTHSD